WGSKAWIRGLDQRPGSDAWIKGPGQTLASNASRGDINLTRLGCRLHGLSTFPPFCLFVFPSMSDSGEPSRELRVSPPLAIEAVNAIRLLPPRGARQLIPREALMARLLEARRQRCVVIQGPAGSSKTSTLLAL